jgi:nucleotide-binding universal stress UspA family protein
VPAHVVVPLSHVVSADRALRFARRLAARAGAGVVLVTATDPPSIPQRRVELEALAVMIRQDGLPVETFVRPTLDPAPLILTTAAAHAPSVICMTTRPPGRTTDLCFGTLTERVLAGAEGPVILVGPRAAAVDADVESLVAGVDGSPASEVALGVVGAWASRLGLAVELVEVVDRATTAGADLAHDQRELRSLGVEARATTLHGVDAADTLAHHLRLHPGGLLVVGTRGHGGLSRRVMGSVAARVVERSPVPVVVVR